MNSIDAIQIHENPIKIGNYILHYNNEESAKQTIEEVFNELPYTFQTTKKNPFIIDAGSNIGISCLYFKMQYPDARILCFEPDPSAFSLLKKNVTVNKLQNVTLINAALSQFEGKIHFYGQVNVENPDVRGNSIIDAWGLQRKNSGSIVVDSVKLSKHINHEVDFLKLDIEGAEQQVLTEIENKLQFVRSLAIEVHQTDQIKDVNDIKKIVSLLNNNAFDINTISKNNSILPVAIKDWAEKVSPHLSLIKANRSS